MRFDPARSIHLPSSEVARVKAIKYVVCIWPIAAVVAPQLFMSRGMSGAVKLMPTASRKTVASSAASSFVIGPGQ